VVQVNGPVRTPAEALSSAAAVKITDFGLSHRLPNGQDYAVGMCVGTQFFMAPEVLKLSHFYPASDVFSFGVILWELMAGTPAFIKPCAPFPFLWCL
jgi:eukaryotic-like serine/threonine-protein kinase